MNNRGLVVSAWALCIAWPGSIFAASQSAGMPTAIGFGLSGLIALVALASAYLPLTAYRYWRGGWRKAALAPLLILLLLAVWILAGRAADPASHPAWQLNIFAWAMANMVYMVAVLTIKSILDKAGR